MYIEIPFSDCLSRLVSWLMQSENGISIYISVYQSTKTVSLYTYQYISRLMQSENGISIYILVDLCNQKTAYYCCFTYFYAMKMKKKWKKGCRVWKGGMLCPVHKHLCTWEFSSNNGANSHICICIHKNTIIEQKAHDSLDTQISNCSIPCTELKPFNINHNLQRSQDSWDQHIHSI
jgi:hypothetical protein